MIERKSLAVQLITAVLLMLGAYAGMFGPIGQAWLGIVSMALTLVLSTFFPSGTPVKGWTIVMWVTNIGGIVTQLANAMNSSGVVNEKTTLIINSIMIGVNIIIQVFAKDYSLKSAK